MGKSSRVRVGLVVLVVFLAAILASGCGAEPATFGEYYDGTWLFGEHEVRYLERFQGVQGEFQGSFFLASGTLGGSFGTEQMIMFSWERRLGERFMTTLPASKFRVLIDELKGPPTVEFQFYADGRTRYNSDCHPRRGELEEANPNDYLMDPDNLVCGIFCYPTCYFGGLKAVNVRISSEALEKEIYLPK